MIPYRAMLDVPAELLRYLTRLLAAERRRRGTPARSRKLTRRDQALLTLRWFRDRTRPWRLAAGHGISRATAYRYLAEAVDVLSAQAPGLDEALNRAMADGVPYVILDGKIFGTGRLGETELPRVFRTGNSRLINAASCPFRNSSMTSCGVRYPSPEWIRVLL